MFTINDDLSIYATRGDVVFFSVTAEGKDGNHKFQPGDIVRFKVYGKKDAESVVLQKDFPVTEVTEKVDIFLTEHDTKIGDVISKPKDYWYEVELNPYDDPQTIIGYDEDGAKVFKLFPEGDDAVDSDPEIKPGDIPVVDNELDLTSQRPVQNQAIARAVTKLEAGVKDNKTANTELSEQVAASDAAIRHEVSVERARVDNLLSGATADDAEVVDVRVGADGVTYASAGTAVREQFSATNKHIDRLGRVELSKNLFNYKTAKNGYTITSDGGVFYENSGTIASDYIEVEGGKNYGLFVAVNGSVVSLSTTIGAVYDEGKRFVGTIRFSYSTTTANDVTIPANAKYLVFVISNQHESYISDIMLCEGDGKLPKDIVPYSETAILNGTAYVRREEFEAKPLNGLTWGAVGDSLTDANKLGKGVSNYTDYVAASLGLNLENYGVSGTGFVRNYGGGLNSYVNRLEDTLSENCDIVTIFGSFNDPQETELQNESVKIGEATDDANAGTLCGAINKVLDIVFAKNPLCKVILFSPVPWGGYWNRYTNTDATAKIDKYNGAIEGVAKRRGVMYKNLTDTSNMRPWSDEFCAAYYLDKDTTHPNTDGHREFIAPLVESAIREIMHKYI